MRFTKRENEDLREKCLKAVRRKQGKGFARDQIRLAIIEAHDKRGIAIEDIDEAVDKAYSYARSQVPRT